MINAYEARKITEDNRRDDKIINTYLNNAETLIKEAASKGDYNCIFEFDKYNTPSISEEVIKNLTMNGYRVKSIQASYYFEWGAIKINW